MLDVIHECVRDCGPDQAGHARWSTKSLEVVMEEKNCRALMYGILASGTSVSPTAPQNENHTHRFLQVHH